MERPIPTKRNEKQVSKDINTEWLALLSKLNGGTKVTSSSVKIHYKESAPLNNVPVEALFELYGNLIMAGFEKDEALVIVCSVIRTDYAERAN
jgi:hypothetical protein